MRSMQYEVLKEIRRQYFGQNMLNIEEVLEILNGHNWLKLAGYIKNALAYREKIITEVF